MAVFAIGIEIHVKNAGKGMDRTKLEQPVRKKMTKLGLSDLVTDYRSKTFRLPPGMYAYNGTIFASDLTDWLAKELETEFCTCTIIAVEIRDWGVLLNQTKASSASVRLPYRR